MGWRAKDRYNNEHVVLDLSNLNTSNITDMSLMFSNCEADEIIFGNFDTSNVKSMRQMFYGCTTPELNLTCFNTSNVCDARWMFRYCTANTIKLTSFCLKEGTLTDFMFQTNAVVDTLDVRGFNLFDTMANSDVYRLFDGCKTTALMLNNAKHYKLIMKGLNGHCPPKELKNANSFIDPLPDIGTMLLKDGIEYRFGLLWNGLTWTIPEGRINVWGVKALTPAHTSRILSEISGVPVRR